jgi:hypothetical protein
MKKSLVRDETVQKAAEAIAKATDGEFGSEWHTIAARAALEAVLPNAVFRAHFTGTVVGMQEALELLKQSTSYAEAETFILYRIAELERDPTR